MEILMPACAQTGSRICYYESPKFLCQLTLSVTLCHWWCQVTMKWVSVKWLFLATTHFSLKNLEILVVILPCINAHTVTGNELPVQRYCVAVQYLHKMESNWSTVLVSTLMAHSCDMDNTGFMVKMWGTNQDITSDHCLIRCKCLWVKFLKQFWHTFSPVLYQDLWSEYTSVLVHVEVQWLSHGKVLTYFSELCVKTQPSLALKEQKEVHKSTGW